MSGRRSVSKSVIETMNVFKVSQKFAASQAGAKAVAEPASPKFGRMDATLEEVSAAALRARNYLLDQQHPDGYWCGELEADSMLEADYIFGHVLLGTGDPGKMQRAMNEILRYQKEDGGLVDLSWRALEYQPVGEVLSGGKADGDISRRAGDGEGAGVDSGPWRGGGM